MAIAIVHFFEAVQISKGHGVGAVGVLGILPNLLNQGKTIWQSGQVIMQGVVVSRRFICNELLNQAPTDKTDSRHNQN